MAKRPHMAVEFLLPGRVNYLLLSWVLNAHWLQWIRGLVHSPIDISPESGAHQSDLAGVPHSAPGDPCAALSNDYLNHYSEALMLIELAAVDREVIEDLRHWRPVDYRAYFGASHLRRAPQALAAYEALPAERRAAFEEMTQAMNRLATTAVRALRPPCEPNDAMLVAEVTGPALRRLIGRAAAFLNSAGADLTCDGEVDEAQSAIDALIERVGV